MKYNKKIPIEQESIRLMIKSFEDGDYEYRENFREHPTVTQNGRGAAIWNNIHTQLVNNFSGDDYQSGKIARGPWSLIYVYDRKSKYLYTFMREANFNNLQKGKKSDHLYHYSNILSRLNDELLGQYQPEYKQMSLFNDVSFDDDVDKRLGELLNEMINSIDGEISRYAIVLADCSRGVVNEIECVIPMAYSAPMYREDWNEYIQPDFDTSGFNVKETKPDESTLSENSSSDIKLSIREDEERKAK